METEKNTAINEVGAVLLETGTLLMSSGAHTEKIRVTINRISERFGYKSELLITQKALTLSIYDQQNACVFSSLKRTSPHGVNFKVVSGISRMSWNVIDEKWTTDQIKNELERLMSLPRYPRIVVLLAVSLAGASFCRLAEGNSYEMLITFIATFAGLFVKQESEKRGFNPYISIFFGAFMASLIAGLAVKLSTGYSPEKAFATSVLFLIPGVPLINSFIDLIEGNIQNGIVRGTNCVLIAFSIALGLLAAVIIYGFK